MRHPPSFFASPLVLMACTVSSMGLLWACGSDPLLGPPSGPDPPTRCEDSLDCPVGELCEAGLCISAEEPALVCQDLVCCTAADCFDYGELCAAAAEGCSCDIVLTAAGSASSTMPVWTAHPGDVVEVGVSLRVGLSLELPVAEASYRLADATAFALEGRKLTALSTAAVTSLDADVLGLAQCSTSLRNLGPAPGAGHLRLYVHDGRSGAPLPLARLVIDVDGDGLDDAASPPTDEGGVALTAMVGPADITVFAAGYLPLTLVGFSGETDVALGLEPLAYPERVGGVSGRLDMDEYERVLLGSRLRPVTMAMVSTSFDLWQLSHFDLDLLLGGPVSNDDCAARPAGCYTFTLPGLFSGTYPVWGGLVLTTAATSLKPQFELTAVPGPRYVWTFAGEFDFRDIEPVIDEVLLPGAGLCVCEQSPGVCDAGCACDSDCGALLGRVLRRVVGLTRMAAAGSRGRLALESVPLDDWMNYLDAPFDSAARDDARFPRLEGEETLAPYQRLGRRTDLHLPPLPADSARPGRHLEGVLVLSGLMSRGAGFVPTGTGVGFDCSGRRCFGVDKDESYDGVIDGAEVCDTNPEAGHRSCATGEAPTVAAEHVAVYASAPPTALVLATPLTIALALPVDSYDPATARLSALLRRGELSTGEVDWRGREFPEAPARLKRQGRRLTELGGSAARPRRIDLVLPAERPGGPGSWQLYVFSGAGGVSLPEPPSTHLDPLGGAVQVIDTEVLACPGAAAPEVLSPWDLERSDGFVSSRYALVDGPVGD